MKLTNVQIIEPENRHHYIVKLTNEMAALGKQIISCKEMECTTDAQNMFASQSHINNFDLLELDE